MKAYEEQLPEGYIEAKTIDAKKGTTAILLNLGALLVMLATLVAAWFAIFGSGSSFTDSLSSELMYTVWRLVFILVAYVLYIVLHELTHGVVYKLFTKQKLTFGLTLSVAYCGVPDIYVYRRTALCALLAPFCVFLPVFLVPIFLLPQYIDRFIFAFLLAAHLGGCVGDLYDAALYVFRFRDPSTLMRDTGPKQTFYVRADSD